MSTASASSSLDKIFKAYDVRAVYPEPLSEEAAWKVGYATAKYLKDTYGGQTSLPGVTLRDTIVVGRDMRPHSPALVAKMKAGIKAAGMNVIDIGMIDTSMIYFGINHLGAIGGIQTTASHNPIQYNGFKISGPQAKPIGSNSGLNDIKAIALGLTSSSGTGAGKEEERDVWEAYRAHVLKFLDLKRPIKIVVDGSNGMAGVMVPKVFGGVKKLTIVPILFEITGSFVHDPNPLVEKNLEMLRAKQSEVRDADLAAMFDGDADRCLFLDEKGKTIGCDIMTALLAKDFLAKPENKGSAIVYDLRSSHVVIDEVKAAGGVPVRDRVGHAFIKKTLKEQNAVFGGELSGHFYFRDNFYADSGAIAFACLLTVLSKQPKKISELIAPLYTYYPSGEVNFQVEDKDGTIKTLEAKYSAQGGKVDHLDGITVDLSETQGWWFNVRKSNTEPLLRLNLEAKTPQIRDQKYAELQQILGHPAEGH